MKQIIIKPLEDYKKDLEYFRSNNYLLVEVDFENISNDREFFKIFASKLNFPKYFGWNLNAFNECLLDLSWLGKIKVVVLIKNLEKIFDNTLLPVLLREFIEAYNFHKLNNHEFLTFIFMDRKDNKEIVSQIKKAYIERRKRDSQFMLDANFNNLYGENETNNY